MQLIKPRSYFTFKELSAARCFLCCLISGLITGICSSVSAIWFLCFLSLIPFSFVMLCVRHSAKRHFFLSITFFASYYAPVLIWLYALSPLIAGELSPIASIMIMTLALILVLLIVCTVASICLLPLKWLSSPSVTGLIIFVSLFALGEFAIAHMGALSFPWVRLGNAAVGCTPFIQSAALFGNLFIGMLILTVSGLSALAVYNAANRKNLTLYSLAALLLIGINFLYGFIAMPRSSKPETQVLLVQGNYSDSKKWREDIISTYEKYEALTLSELTPETKLVVWPETAMTVELDKYPWLKDSLKELCMKNDITLVTGAFHSVTSGTESNDYNALYVITPDGQISEPYYKQALVPVGEFIPLLDTIRVIAPWLIELRSQNAYDQLSFGWENKIYRTPIGKISGIICYESIIPHLVREQSSLGSELLVMITNDSWFGTSSALAQHLAHAQMRAVENGRYLVRAGNTGITAIIAPSGKILYELNPDTAAALPGKVSMLDKRTLYSYIGDSILLPGLLLALYTGAYYIYDCIMFKKKKQF